KKATLFFSSNLASIVNVIPAMDKLDTNLNTCSKETYHPAIITAMALAWKKLNRYHELTNLSDAYHIAMILHPGLKLEYFCKQGWEPEWIDNGKTITQDAFANYEGLD
ncbi:hypothetical protein L208DRAFT_1213582, partial [Tricholoma matsutake]